MFRTARMLHSTRRWRHGLKETSTLSSVMCGLVMVSMHVLCVLGILMVTHVSGTAFAFSGAAQNDAEQIPQCNGDERVKLCRMYRLQGFDVLLRLRKQTASENKIYKRVSFGWGLDPATEAPMHFVLIKTPLATTEVCHGIDPHDMQSGITETGDFWCAMSKDPLRCIRCENAGSYASACKIDDWTFYIAHGGVIEEKRPEAPEGSVYDGKAIWKFKNGVCEYSNPFSKTYTESSKTSLDCSATAGWPKKRNVD